MRRAVAHKRCGTWGHQDGDVTHLKTNARKVKGRSRLSGNFHFFLLFTFQPSLAPHAPLPQEIRAAAFGSSQSAFEMKTREMRRAVSVTR